MKKQINPVIYKIINLINNKIYIGKDLYNNPKYMGSGKLLKQAFKKYGKINFKKEIIEKCNDINQLNEREKFWIKNLNTFSPNGYNINVGGKGGDTYTYRSQEEKLKFRENLKIKKLGKKCSIETIEIFKKARKGKPQKRRENVECPYCHKIGDKLNMMRWHFDFCKENPNRIIKNIKKIKCCFCKKEINIANAYQWHFDFCKENPNRIIKRGHPQSIESKIKIGNKSRGRKHTIETKIKIGNKSKGRKKTEETKNKLSISMKKRWKNNINIYKCIYCNKKSKSLGNINRWHNENCKFKK